MTSRFYFRFGNYFTVYTGITTRTLIFYTCPKTSRTYSNIYQCKYIIHTSILLLKICFFSNVITHMWWSSGITLKRPNSSSNYNRLYRTTCRPSEMPMRLLKWSHPILRSRRVWGWNIWTNQASIRATHVC